ncbi:hypothetical protein AALP_AA2G248000 [Arabis alpina]|uniref:Uncharacterized protein n=1 Tax=Arabis alpina TaxID=50452 RepID=A0A087HJS3_ARAAL|nr:hypothetical protein AALP_AA2G248000 [Arabis alpina]
MCAYSGFGVIKAITMVLDGIVSSPLRRPHALKKQWEDLGNCSTVVQRHMFFLTAIVGAQYEDEDENPKQPPITQGGYPEELGSPLTSMIFLAFLCTVYIYFAVILGGRHLSCSDMTGKAKAMCQMEHVQVSFSKGKLKFFL